MIYSILEFIADKWWIFLLIGFIVLNDSYMKTKKEITYFKFVFCFQLLEIIYDDFKPRKEIKNFEDKVYNFKEYFVFSFWFILIGGAYLCLYLGMLGVILKTILKLIEKGA